MVDANDQEKSGFSSVNSTCRRMPVIHQGLKMRFVVTVLVVLLGLQTMSKAWVYPEHRDIAVLAVLDLEPEKRKTLNKLWELARTGHEDRLPAYIVIPHLPDKPQYIDWAAWPAIGGDHSCSLRT